MTRGEIERDNGLKKGKGHQGTCIKDPWTKPTGSKTEGGRWVLVGWGEAVAEKWRQLYLNNNEITK